MFNPSYTLAIDESTNKFLTYSDHYTNEEIKKIIHI
jgi:hypothetical protein